MTIRYRTVSALLVILALAVMPQFAGAAKQAYAKLQNANGDAVGMATLHRTSHGTLLHVKLHDLPAGAHAFHVHSIGKCEPPFKSAGGHYNPEGRNHGILGEDGMHAGDMPNIHVPESGSLEIEILNTQLVLDTALFDEDGAAIVIHEGADDYKSDPAGAAGPRIACGILHK